MMSSDWYDGYDAGLSDAESDIDWGLVLFCILAPIIFFVGAHLVGTFLR